MVVCSGGVWVGRLDSIHLVVCSAYRINYGMNIWHMIGLVCFVFTQGGELPRIKDATMAEHKDKNMAALASCIIIIIISFVRRSRLVVLASAPCVACCDPQPFSSVNSQFNSDMPSGNSTTRVTHYTVQENAILGMDKKPSKSKGHLTPLKHPAVEALVSYSLEDARVRDGHQRIATGHLTPLKHPAVEASTLQSQHNCRRGPRFLLKTRNTFR